MNDIRTISLLLLLAVTGCRTIDPAAYERHEFKRIEMGMIVQMTLYAKDPAQSRLAAKTAFDRIRELNQILSDYEDDSELNRVRHSSGSGDWIEVSPELWTVLRQSARFAKESDGAFDITAGPVIQLWKRARRQRALPDPAKLAEARTRTGHYYIHYRESDRAVILWRKGMRLDLGGIAKGYAMDEAMKVLNREGIRSALITGGGDMVAGDPPPGKPGWKIELPQLNTNAPPAFIRLANAAFATSGDRYQYVVLDGKRYSHIVDPRTGVGLTDHSLVYVIAPSGMIADGLATTSSVLNPTAATKLAADHQAEIKIQKQPDTETQVFTSAGFNRFRWR